MCEQDIRFLIARERERLQKMALQHSNIVCVFPHKFAACMK